MVPIHRHPESNENVLLLCGKLIEIIYEEVDPLLSPLKGDNASAFEMGMDAQNVTNGKRLREVARYVLDPSAGAFGCVVPAGAWHTVEVLEPSVIYEAKDGKYGEDGTISISDARLVMRDDRSALESVEVAEKNQVAPESCLGDLKSQITYLIGMEHQSGSMDAISPLYVARMLNVPLEEVEAVMAEMGL